MGGGYSTNERTPHLNCPFVRGLQQIPNRHPCQTLEAFLSILPGSQCILPPNKVPEITVRPTQTFKVFGIRQACAASLAANATTNSAPANEGRKLQHPMNNYSRCVCMRTCGILYIYTHIHNIYIHTRVNLPQHRLPCSIFPNKIKLLNNF